MFGKEAMLTRQVGRRVAFYRVCGKLYICIRRLLSITMNGPMPLRLMIRYDEYVLSDLPCLVYVGMLSPPGTMSSTKNYVPARPMSISRCGMEMMYLISNRKYGTEKGLRRPEKPTVLLTR